MSRGQLNSYLIYGEILIAQLVALNNPDKIVFVGEALVGNEAVDQLTKFDRALRDFTAASGGVSKERGIDGMLVTKWDTVDDKVCVSPFIAGEPWRQLNLIAMFS